MPTPLNCFELHNVQETYLARVRDDAGKSPLREFAVEANLLRSELAKSGRKNLVIEVQSAGKLDPDQIRGLVFLLREARQRGGLSAFCGGGSELQQALSRFGLSKPTDWFPTSDEALAVILGQPATPAVRSSSPASAPTTTPRPVTPRPAPATAVAAPPVQQAAAWRPPPRGRFLQAHELTLRAHHRQEILIAPPACTHLAAQIRAMSEHFHFSVWAFVFMPDHFHLLVQSRRLNYDIGEYLEAIKQAFQEKGVEILGEHAPQVLNRLRRRQGSKYVYDFWQKSGGQNRNIESTLPVRPLIQHLHENPVRRGLVERATDWKWSSAGAYAGAPLPQLQPDPVPPELLGP